jgi:F-type H+-transporting ATPase subunit a
MLKNCVKFFTVAAFSIILSFTAGLVFAQETPENPVEKEPAGAKPKKGFDAKEVIFGHVMDGHEFHFLDISNNKGEKHPVTIPLPVILYSPQRGLTSFMSSRLHHGEEDYKGYSLLTAEKIEAWKLDPKKYSVGQIVGVDDKGELDTAVKVFDISLTRNVVQMLISLVFFVWMMLLIAKRYNRKEGVHTAPKGVQNFMEPIITFIRDEVAKPNLAHKWEKYLPYLLTVFFFILINNIVGLIPGTANVTGNIAFTAVLGLISFIVILASSNGHYWGHIFNPPGVPLGVKFILVPVEFLSVFIKPFALIIRLFANMVAGHIIIICLISLIFIFGQIKPAIGWGASPVSIAFCVFIYLIEVLVAFLQAYIFTNLTAVFVGQAFEGEHHDGHH